MTDTRRVSLSPAAAAATIAIVLLVGAGATYLIMRANSSHAITMSTGAAGAVTPSRALPAPSAGETPSTPLSDVRITLSPDAITRAGIEVSHVSTAGAPDRIRLPGVVEPNAYRQVTVTPLVSGRIVGVSVQLGDRVRAGQTIANVYSPELAEARTKYLASKAMLDAHDRELQRTQKLVEIGAASRQEIERIHAEHAAQTAEVESARSRLQLLGAGDASSLETGSDATIKIPAPIDGVVTERMANVGLNVDSTTRLFTVVDLSNVWIIADVYERDLHRVREGARATVTTNAYPDLALGGRVSYIDPQLNAGTRTAKVRVEVANPRRELRLGMYTDVAIQSGAGTPVLTVSKQAIQNVADRQVVYVAPSGETGTFIEREVRLGRSSGDLVEVISGLKPGDAVVSKGSFFIRAEAERLGLRTAPSPAGDTRQSGTANVQTARVAVTEKGYEPDRVTLRSGVPARLTVVRTTDKTCGTAIVFPSLNINRALPLNEPVVIEFTPSKAGDIAFTCGMKMLKGTIVVQ